MFVELKTPNGSKYNVEVTVKYDYVGDKPVDTTITVKYGTSKYVGKASCHVTDNVNKTYGRRAALKDLFSKNNVFFTKDNRRVLYQALIPKLVNRPIKQKVEDKNNGCGFETTVGFSYLSLFLFFVILGLVSYLWR